MSVQNRLQKFPPHESIYGRKLLQAISDRQKFEFHHFSSRFSRPWITGINWGARENGWPLLLTLYCPMRNAGQMTIGNLPFTLEKSFLTIPYLRWICEVPRFIDHLRNLTESVYPWLRINECKYCILGYSNLYWTFLKSSGSI